MHPKNTITVVLVALYRFQNFPIRILHAQLEAMKGVDLHTVFFKNHLTNAIQQQTDAEERLFGETMEALQPDLVGMSVYSPYVACARRLTEIVRNRTRALVLWGGIHPTLSPESCMEEADIICRGEGEGALSELVSALGSGREFRGIENLWVRQGDGIRRNPMRPLIQNLDAMPFPAYDRPNFSFIESDRVWQDDPAIEESTLAVMPARGCPFHCSFCVNSLLRPMYKELGPYSRRRSVDNIIEEILSVLRLERSRVRMIEFHDENFGTSEGWLRDFERRYPTEIGLPFKVQYNPTLIRASVVKRLVDCGLHRLKFGIETGTDSIRKRVFNRAGRNRDILRMAWEIADLDVKTRYDLILDNPYDTDDTLRETLAFILRLPKPPRFNLYSLQFFPHYPLTRKALADGHVTKREVSLECLQKRMARNWAFVPRLFPYTERQILQNLIWLYAQRKVGDASLCRAVFQDSAAARIRRHGLHWAAVFHGRINALQRQRSRRPAR
ncbi:MAG: B12-binding domain-containing radical SAM protein [Desulfobacteraceae bacterium]|nr:B12-binding domain-containing radical SAM protein [Desulfobacteraceae bacterium]